MRPLAILGATSRMAEDFVLAAAARGQATALYARRPEAVAAFLAQHGLPADWSRGTLEQFAAERGTFGAVLNFVGIGDPARAQAIGGGIFAATSVADDAALAHLDRHPATPYIFLSSGAVYGRAFDAPVDAASAAIVPVNALAPPDYYGLAKLHAEARHRAQAGATIIDIRIFNYVSRRMDRAARFLISDMVRAIEAGARFETSDEPLVRDYLHPADFCALVLACVAAAAGTNRAVDAYSRAPIDKRALLALMTDAFGLRYRFVPQPEIVHATGAKTHYHSLDRAAATLGYAPTRASADALREEVGAMLAGAA